MRSFWSEYHFKEYLEYFWETVFVTIDGIVVMCCSNYMWNIIINNFLAALFRCIAMHCYSAIPDIEPDDKAWLKTTAVYLWKQNSLLYCWLLYLLSAIFSFSSLWWFSIFWWIIYLTIMIISYKRKDIFWMYKLFPYINLILWFLLFRYIILYI